MAANGSGLDAFWRTLLSGQSGIAPITLFDCSDLACQIAGEVKNFAPDDLIDPSLRPHRLARFSQLAVVTAKMATDDAGLSRDELRKQEELHIILGVSTSAMDLLVQPTRIHSAIAFVPDAATSAVAYMLTDHPNFLTISDGCASSLESIARGADLIRSGETDIVVAGGAESSMTHRSFEGMLKCRKCSTRNHDPQGASRPFDRDRDFGVMAEGSAVVVIEHLERALARGRRPYAEIVAWHVHADEASGQEGSGLQHSMQMAISNSGHQPADVDLVSAHGPSDVHMDLLETDLIKRVFGEAAYGVPVVSIKGAVGCPSGAGGGMQVVASALSIRDQVIPPTCNFHQPGEGCDLDYVPGRSRLSRVGTVLVNSHGFGRNNCSMVLRRVD